MSYKKAPFLSASLLLHSMGQIIKSLASFCRSWDGHSFNSILMKCAQSLGELEVKVRYDTFLCFARIIHLRNAFSVGRSRHHCNETRGPIVAVNSSHDATRRLLYAESWKCHNFLFCPLKHRNGYQRTFDGNALGCVFDTTYHSNHAIYRVGFRALQRGWEKGDPAGPGVPAVSGTTVTGGPRLWRLRWRANPRVRGQQQARVATCDCRSRSWTMVYIYIYVKNCTEI